VAADRYRRGAPEQPSGVDPGAIQLRSEDVDPRQLAAVVDPAVTRM
jgi:hypothetical protein